jgi:hypothetical protein
MTWEASIEKTSKLSLQRQLVRGALLRASIRLPIKLQTGRMDLLVPPVGAQTMLR